MRQEKEYTWVEGLAICLGMIGVQLATQIIAQWGVYFYSPSQGIGRTVYVSVGLVGLFFIIGTIWDAITDPLVGMWSDRTRTRPTWLRLLPIRGRRRPFIFWGSIFMVFTSIFFWYPPIRGTSNVNFIYGTVLLCLHWAVFTVTVVPLTSLGPEIARSEKARVSLGIWTAVGMIVGLAMAIVLPGILFVQFDPARVDDSFTIEFENASPPQVQEAVAAILPEELQNDIVFDANETGLQVRLSEVHAGEFDYNAEGGETSVVFHGALLGALDFAHIEEAVSGLLPASLTERFRLDAFPGGQVARFDGEDVNADEACAIGRALSAVLERELDRRLIVRSEEGSSSFVFSGGLVGKLDVKCVELAVSALLPENLREGCRATADETTLTVALGNPALAALDSASLREDMVALLAAEQQRAQFRFVRNEGAPHAIFGNDLLVLLNERAIDERLAASLGGVGHNMVRVQGSISAIGFRRVAILFAIITFVLIQLPVWLVRERYDSEAKTPEKVSLLRNYTDAFRNYPFVIYCLAYFLFTTGFIAAQNVLPYFAELGLGGDESTVSLLMIPFIIVCIVFFVVVPALTRRLHTKWMTFLCFLNISTGLPFMYVIPMLDVSVGTKTILGALLFGYCGIGQSIMYVMMTPMLGEIIDYDELRSGQRREALYNGLHGLTNKIAIAFAILLATQSMSRWGNSVVDPGGVFLVGPFAGILGFFGMIAILFYPVMHVARDKDED